jgi:hypothetical protein
MKGFYGNVQIASAFHESKGFITGLNGAGPRVVEFVNQRRASVHNAQPWNQFLGTNREA